jgi:hypothetical protein
MFSPLFWLEHCFTPQHHSGPTNAQLCLWLGTIARIARRYGTPIVERRRKQTSDRRVRRFKRPYTELVYLPMVELLEYLRANGFKTFIVSGGVVEFMRPWTERLYGVPPEEVVGSSIKTKFQMRDRPELFRSPQLNVLDDGADKPVGINEYTGRRPIAAFGNSDGDHEMLQWGTTAGGVRLGLIVHHTDAEREYAYDRDTPFGRLGDALDAAALSKWTVVDMKSASSHSNSVVEMACLGRSECG